MEQQRQTADCWDFAARGYRLRRRGVLGLSPDLGDQEVGKYSRLKVVGRLLQQLADLLGKLSSTLQVQQRQADVLAVAGIHR